MYIRQIIDLEREKGVKEVVDGQQRLRSIIGFRQDEFAARHPSHSKKVLFSELTKREQAHFLETKLSVGYLIGAEDPDVIEIFGRINSISKTLNPQEKRNARYSGDFKQFCLKQAAIRLPFWRDAGIFSANDIARMQEVQFLSDVAINLIEGLADFSATKIDAYYQRLDSIPLNTKKISLNGLKKYLLISSQSAHRRTLTLSFPFLKFYSSFMVAMDSTATFLRGDKLTNCILEIDRLIRDARTWTNLPRSRRMSSLGFTGGNLHRIRARRIRNDVICRELERHESAAERSRPVLSPVGKLLSLVRSLHPLQAEHQKLVAEVVMIRLFMLLETVVESICCKLCCGATYLDGTTPSLIVRQRSVAQAFDSMETFRRLKPRRARWNDGAGIRENLRASR